MRDGIGSSSVLWKKLALLQFYKDLARKTHDIGSSSVLWKKLALLQFYRDLARKTDERCSWFKFSKLRLVLGMASEFYSSVAKGFQLKARKIWRLIPKFGEVTEEKLVAGIFNASLPTFPSPTILNMVKPGK